MDEKKKKLQVNCGFAFLQNDREGMLDNYDHVQVNCGTAVISSVINAKLSAKGVQINSGNTQVRDIKGEIIQLNNGSVIDGSSGLKGFFVIGNGSLLVKKEGMNAVEESEGLISMGTVFYPDSAALSSLHKIVLGEKRPYPADAHVILDDQILENLIANYRDDKKHIWISGRLTALDRKALEQARSKGFTFSSGSFFSYEGLNEEFGDLINSEDRVLVPDGFEIIREIKDGELGFYAPPPPPPPPPPPLPPLQPGTVGNRIYVEGELSMNEKDIPALEELDAVIVKGKASLPAGAFRTFRNKGRAGDYFVYEGRLVKINGTEQFSHSQLEASVNKGEKITLLLNGKLIFDEDVRPEDIECIASLSYNGEVLISGPAKAELAKRVKEGNGFMGEPAKLAELTGQNDSGGSGNSNKNSMTTQINMGMFLLV